MYLELEQNVGGSKHIGYITLSATSTNKSDTDTIDVTLTLYSARPSDTTVSVVFSGGHSHLENYGVGKHFTLSCEGATIANSSYNTSTVTVAIGTGETTKVISMAIENNTVLELDRDVTIWARSFGAAQTVTIIDDNIPATDTYRNIIDITNPNKDWDSAATARTGLTAADNTGATSSQSAIQDAIDWLHTNNGGGIIYYPDGTYLTDTGSIQLWENISHCGESKSGTQLVVADRYYLDVGGWMFSTDTNYASNTISANTGAFAWTDMTLNGNRAGNIGPELVTNGSFATDTEWTKGANWAISGGTANHTTGSVEQLTQSLDEASGENLAYTIFFTVSGMTAGTVQVTLNDYAKAYPVRADGEYATTAVATSPVTLQVIPDTDFDGSIDDISVFLIPSDQRHIIKFYTDSDNGSQALSYLDNIYFINGGGDGINLTSNAKCYAYEITHLDAGRSTICISGGNCDVNIKNLSVSSTPELRSPTSGGYEAEVKVGAPGYDDGRGPYRYTATLDNITQGRLESTVETAYEAIQGMTRADPCVVTWVGHGMISDDEIQFSNTTGTKIPQEDWTALNGVVYEITRINDDSFSIPVDTSGYAGDYNAETDPGQIGKFHNELSTFSGSDLTVTYGCAIVLPGHRQTVLIEDSSIDCQWEYSDNAGKYSPRAGISGYSKDTTLNRVTFTLTEVEPDPTGPVSMVHCTDILNYGTPRLTEFNDCDFEIADGVTVTPDLFAISNNGCVDAGVATITIDDCRFASAIDYIQGPLTGGAGQDVTIQNYVDIGCQGIGYLTGSASTNVNWNFVLSGNTLSSNCTKYAYISSATGDKAENTWTDTDSVCAVPVTWSAAAVMTDNVLTGGKTINGTGSDPGGLDVVHGLVGDTYTDGVDTWVCDGQSYLVRPSTQVTGLWNLSAASGWTFFTNARKINTLITYDAAWADIDLGTTKVVPTGATGVILQVQLTGSTSAYKALTRPNESEENRSDYAEMTAARHKYLFAKLDANRVFDGYFDNAALDVYVVACTGDSADQFFATTTDKSLGDIDSYVNIDCSAIIPAGGKAAIVDVHNVHATNGRLWGLHVNDSSDDFYAYMAAKQNCVAFMGLDSGRVGEGKISATDLDFYVWGYLASGWTFFDAALDVTPTSTGWQDCHHASVPAGAKGVIVELWNDNSSARAMNVRKKGSSDNITTSVNVGGDFHIHAIVGLDDDGYFQTYLGTTTEQKVYILGYYS